MPAAPAAPAAPAVLSPPLLPSAAAGLPRGWLHARPRDAPSGRCRLPPTAAPGPGLQALPDKEEVGAFKPFIQHVKVRRQAATARGLGGLRIRPYQSVPPALLRRLQKQSPCITL